MNRRFPPLPSSLLGIIAISLLLPHLSLAKNSAYKQEAENAAQNAERLHDNVVSGQQVHYGKVMSPWEKAKDSGTKDNAKDLKELGKDLREAQKDFQEDVKGWLKAIREFQEGLLDAVLSYQKDVRKAVSDYWGSDDRDEPDQLWNEEEGPGLGLGDGETARDSSLLVEAGEDKDVLMGIEGSPQRIDDSSLPGAPLRPWDKKNIRGNGYDLTNKPPVLPKKPKLPARRPRYRPDSESEAIQVVLARAGLRPDVGIAEVSIPKRVLPGESPKREIAEVPLQDAAAQAATKLGLGDMKAAMAMADKALAANPRNAVAFMVKAKALIHLNRFADAETAARKAVEADPHNAAAFRTLGWALLNQGKLEDAMASLTKAIALGSQDARSHLMRAMVQEQMGYRDAMMSDLRKAADLNPAYEGHLKIVQRGDKLFDPNADDPYKLLDPIDEGGPTRSSPLPGLFLFLICAAAGSAVVFSLLRRPRRKAASMDAMNGPVSPPRADGLLAGKYRMLSLIGKGRMGQIWKALDSRLNRRVAIKKMIFNGVSDEEGRSLAVKEARMLAQVHHPNIVDIIEIIDEPSGLYLVFELLTGKTLEEIILNKKRLPLRDAKALLRGVCSALAYSHQRGIIHRDLKPANIMVTKRGYVKVMDFGIAREAGEEAFAAAPPLPNGGPGSMMPSATTRTIAGTPMYMAPEAYQGVFSPSVDVYALGIMFYEMVVGEPPTKGFEGAGKNKDFAALVRDSTDPDPGKRPGLEEFVKRMEAVPDLLIPS